VIRSDPVDHQAIINNPVVAVDVLAAFAASRAALKLECDVTLVS
jgi:hypothetical protein